MQTAITPHGSCSALGQLGSLTCGVAAPNGITSPQSNIGLPEGSVSTPSAKGTSNGSTSASNNLALPAAVSLLLASNLEMGNRHISPSLSRFPFH